MRQWSDIIDLRVLEKFCKVTGLCRQDALNLLVHYVAFVSEGKAVAQELDRLPELYLGKLIESGFLNHDFVAENFDTNGGFMTDEMLLTLVSNTLEDRFMFSLSDLLLVNLKVHHRDEMTDDEDNCFIEELPSDDDETVGSEEEEIGDDDNIDYDEDDSDVDDGDDDDEHDDDDDDFSHASNGNDEEVSEDGQSEAAV